MGDEIDFDDLLAEAEQEQMCDDDFMMDDIEAELAMEAEVSVVEGLVLALTLAVSTHVTALEASRTISI